MRPPAEAVVERSNATRRLGSAPGSKRIGTSGRAAIGRIVARVVAAGCQAATLLLLARALGPQEFGPLGQALSLGIIGAAIFGFGLTLRAIRIGVEADSRRLASTMYLIRFISAGLAGSLLYALMSATGVASHSAIVAASTLLISNMLNELSQAILSGRESHAAASTAILFQRVVPLALVLAAGSSERALQLFSVANIVTALAGAAPALVERAKPMGMASVLRSTTPYWAASVMAPLASLDVTVARLAVGQPAFGQYAAASRIGAPLNLAVSALVSIYTPRMAAMQETDRVATFVHLRRICIILAAFIISGAPLVADALVGFLGQGYASGKWLVVGLIAAAGVSGVSQSYQALEYAQGAPWRVARAVSVGTVVGLVLLAIGGWWIGPNGLALAPVISQIVVLAIFHFGSTHRRKSEKT